MKIKTTIISLLLLLVSCNKEPKQYSLTTNDIQKLEELNCNLLAKYEKAQKNISVNSWLQSGVTNLGEQYYLNESINAEKELLSSIEAIAMSLKTIGIECKGTLVELSPEEIASRVEFLNAVKTNMENNAAWRDGVKLRSIEDLNAQTELTAKLSTQMK